MFRAGLAFATKKPNVNPLGIVSTTETLIPGVLFDMSHKKKNIETLANSYESHLEEILAPPMILGQGTSLPEKINYYSSHFGSLASLYVDFGVTNVLACEAFYVHKKWDIFIEAVKKTRVHPQRSFTYAISDNILIPSVSFVSSSLSKGISGVKSAWKFITSYKHHLPFFESKKTT